MRPTAAFVSVVLAGLLLAGCGTSPRKMIDEGIEDFQLGRFDPAEAKIRSGLGAEPGNVDGLFYLGRILQLRGRYERAIYYYRLCLDMAPGYRGARKFLAQAQQEAGQQAATRAAGGAVP